MHYERAIPAPIICPCAGLYLPTSDVDLVVLDSGCSDIVRGLRAIGNKLVDGAMAKNIQVSCPKDSTQNLAS